LAGYFYQGKCAIAIGNFAGQMNQPSNSIAIGPSTHVSGTCQTHIGPMRHASGPYQLYYCPCSREITYN
jgi:hypothetical protein